MLNVEIKARCTPAHQLVIRKLLKEVGEPVGTDHQIDTYFFVPNGRLKLREGNIENKLVQYRREDQAGPKDSKYTLVDPTPGLKEALTAALGVMAVVDKTREIYYVGNVKIHLDTVVNLGTFMEIEARDEDETIGREQLLRQCQNCMERLGIEEKDLITCSYSDMMLDLIALRMVEHCKKLLTNPN